MFLKKTNKQLGQEAEEAAVQYLALQGMLLLAQNFQSSGRGMADLDAVMQDQDGTVVFVEVKLRSSPRFGSGASSVTFSKQKRLIQAAQYFLMRFKTMPKCRFDVVVFEGNTSTQPLWFKSAFEAV